jgi:hypothetical protein
MRPDNYSVFWKCFFERWYELLEVPKDSLFMIPQSFGILTAHTPGCLSEPGFFPWFFHWLKQILCRMESIYVIEIGVNEDEIPVSVADCFRIPLVEDTNFRPQQVTTGVASDMNWHSSRQVGILTPQFSVIFTPGKQMGHIVHPYSR